MYLIRDNINVTHARFFFDHFFPFNYVFKAWRSLKEVMSVSFGSRLLLILLSTFSLSLLKKKTIVLLFCLISDFLSESFALLIRLLFCSQISFDLIKYYGLFSVLSVHTILHSFTESLNI